MTRATRAASAFTSHRCVVRRATKSRVAGHRMTRLQHRAAVIRGGHAEKERSANKRRLGRHNRRTVNLVGDGVADCVNARVRPQSDLESRVVDGETKVNTLQK